MFKELIHTALGASVVIRQKVEDELKTLEKKGKIKTSDKKEFLKSITQKGKAEDKRVKKDIKKLLKKIVEELDLVTKKDLKEFKEDLKDKL